MEWYYYMIPKEDKKGMALLDKFTLVSLHKKLVICFNAFNIPEIYGSMQNTMRFYTVFNNYLIFHEKCMKLDRKYLNFIFRSSVAPRRRAGRRP